MRFIAAATLLAIGLAGCQTLEQSRQTAQEICSESGLRPGTKAFRACVTSHYRQERRQADAAAGALVAGATAGLVGAAIIAEERSSRYDRRGYYGGSAYYGTGGRKLRNLNDAERLGDEAAAGRFGSARLGRCESQSRQSGQGF